MLRTSIYFLVIAIAAFLAADISIFTLDPWLELKRVGLGMLTPDFFSLPEFDRALFNTVSFALLGIVLAITLGSLLSLFFDITVVRLFCSFIRSIHEIFWAFIFMPIVGLNSICGILAIGIPYVGVFAKVYADLLEKQKAQASK